MAVDCSRSGWRFWPERFLLDFKISRKVVFYLVLWLAAISPAIHPAAQAGEVPVAFPSWRSVRSSDIQLQRLLGFQVKLFETEYAEMLPL